MIDTWPLILFPNARCEGEVTPAAVPEVRTYTLLVLRRKRAGRGSGWTLSLGTRHC